MARSEPDGENHVGGIYIPVQRGSTGRTFPLSYRKPLESFGTSQGPADPTGHGGVKRADRNDLPTAYTAFVDEHPNQV